MRDGRGAVVLVFVNESGDANIAAGCVCVYVFQNTPQRPLACRQTRGRAAEAIERRGSERATLDT